LQYEVKRQLKLFLRHDDEKGRLSVRDCLYCKGLQTFPDLTITKRQNPWLILELKEKRRLNLSTAIEERQKINRQLEAMNAKRGYLVYVARFGNRRVLRGPKGPFGFSFFEVPITLERAGMSKPEILDFERMLRKLAKYSPPHS
jgi:hypothetical protein